MLRGEPFPLVKELVTGKQIPPGSTLSACSPPRAARSIPTAGVLATAAPKAMRSPASTPGSPLHRPGDGDGWVINTLSECYACLTPADRCKLHFTAVLGGVDERGSREGRTARQSSCTGIAPAAGSQVLSNPGQALTVLCSADGQAWRRAPAASWGPALFPAGWLQPRRSVQGPSVSCWPLGFLILHVPVHGRLTGPLGRQGRVLEELRRCAGSDSSKPLALTQLQVPLPLVADPGQLALQRW